MTLGGARRMMTRFLGGDDGLRFWLLQGPRHEDDRRGQIVERDRTLVDELPIDLRVVALCELEERQDERDRQHRNPGALDKFRDEDHGEAGAGGKSTCCIDPEPRAMPEPAASI